MKKLFLIAILTLVSMPVFAVDCNELAAQMQGSTSDMSSALQRKYAIQAYNAQCNGGQQQQPQQQQPVNTDPQYVPSIGQWCQVVNGVTNCWK
ncbi:MAG: hypothetical protein WCK96_08995 [Methylococcales bacterium]